MVHDRKQADHSTWNKRNNKNKLGALGGLAGCRTLTLWRTTLAKAVLARTLVLRLPIAPKTEVYRHPHLLKSLRKSPCARSCCANSAFSISEPVASTQMQWLLRAAAERCFRSTFSALHARFRRHSTRFVQYLSNAAEYFDAVSGMPIRCAARTFLDQNLKNSRHDLMPPQWVPYSACALGRSPSGDGATDRPGAPIPLSGRRPTRARRWRPPCSRQWPRGDVGN